VRAGRAAPSDWSHRAHVGRSNRWWTRAPHHGDWHVQGRRKTALLSELERRPSSAAERTRAMRAWPAGVKRGSRRHAHGTSPTRLYGEQAVAPGQWPRRPLTRETAPAGWLVLEAARQLAREFGAAPRPSAALPTRSSARCRAPRPRTAKSARAAGSLYAPQHLARGRAPRTGHRDPHHPCEP
jgi:hypothetical protein